MAIGTPTLIATSANTTDGTSIVVTVPAGGVPAGVTIIVDAVFEGADDSAHACTDSEGNTYAADVAPPEVTVGINARRFRCSNNTALAENDTITVSWTGDSLSDAAIAYYVSGLDLTSPLTGTPTGTESNNSVNDPCDSGSLTTADADAIILGFLGRRGFEADGFTEDSDFTTIGVISANTGAGSTSRVLHSAYRIVSATETQNYAPTTGVGRNWSAGISAYKMAAAAGPTETVGTAAGSSTVSGVGAVILSAEGASAGTSSVSGAGRATVSAAGSSAGTSTAAAVSEPAVTGIQVFIAGVDRTELVDADAGFSWSDQVNGRGQLTFSMADTPVTGFIPEDGAEVLVLKDGVRHFGGHLYEPDAGLVPDRSLMIYECTAVEFSAIPDRFTVTRIYTSQTVDTIIKDIVSQDLDGEDIDVTNVDVGPTIERAVFDDVTATEAFNDLCELVGFSWWIDENRKLHAHARDAITAPAQLDKDTIRLGTLRVRSDRQRYRNKQILKGGKALTDERQEVSVGDGTRRVFSTAFPIGRVPTIETNLNGVGYVEQTVGILGVDTGKAWYWNLSEARVSQDESETVLSTLDTVRVSYQGEFNLKIEYSDLQEITSRAAIEGGTGIHTHVESRPEVDNLNAAIQTTFALIERYGSLGKVITCETREQGLKQGQLVHIEVAEHGLDGDFLIEAVTATVPAGLEEIWYAVTARDGDPFGGWQKFFRDLLKIRKPLTLSKSDDTLTVLRTALVPVVASASVVVDESAPSSLIGVMTIGRGEIGANP